MIIILVYSKRVSVRNNLLHSVLIPSCTITKFGEICHPSELFYPIELFDRLECQSVILFLAESELGVVQKLHGQHEVGR
jgi:hypothetical protein